MKLIGKLLSFPSGIILAMVLGPEDYGLVGVAMLYITYATWINPGIVIAAKRELPGMVKQEQQVEFKHLASVSLSFDLLIAFFVTAGLCAFSMTIDESLMRTLMFIAILGFLVTKLYDYFSAIAYSKLQFKLLTKVKFVERVVAPVLSIVLVFYFKIYVLVLVPVLVQFIGLLVFIKNIRLDFKPTFNWQEFIRLTKVGIPLVLMGFLYKAFIGIADKTIIVRYLDIVQLGLFLYAYSYVNILTDLFRDFGRVLAPVLWRNASDAADDIAAFGDTFRFSVYFAILSAVIGLVAQMFFILLVSTVTVKFKAAVPIFLILSFGIYFEALQIFPEYILSSKRLNKQNYIIRVWGFYLALNVILDIALIILGYGIIGVAIATTITQGGATFTMYFVAHRHFIPEGKSLAGLIKLLFLPFAVLIAITLVHAAILIYHVPLLYLLFTIPLQILIWYLLALGPYQEFDIMRHTRSLIRTICGSLRTRFKIA
ncbi:oligosaccharide flippase family protein [candidate division KSB1 bacterium]|nr:oligosaccharide flippase family protein [candidate division KSB1 bacterium]